MSGLGNSEGHIRRRAAMLAALAAALCSAGFASAGAHGGTPSPQPLWRNYPLNPARQTHAKPALGPYRLTIPDRPAAAPDPRELARLHAASGSAWPTVVVVLAALALVAGLAVFAVWRWRPFGRSPSLLSSTRERVVGGGRDWAVYVVGPRLATAGRSLAGARRRFRTVDEARPLTRAPQPAEPPVEATPAEPMPQQTTAEDRTPKDPLAAIRAELAHARRNRLALSLLLIEAADPEEVERTIAEAAGIDGDCMTGLGLLVLRGVMPRRARQLAEAALGAAAGDGHAGSGVAIGIAGYPRHAQSTDALFRMSRRALEQAAASGQPIVVAADDWAPEEPTAAEEKPRSPRASRHAKRTHGKRKSRSARP